MDKPAASKVNIEAIIFDLGGVIINIDFNRVFQYWAEQSNTSAQLLQSRFTLDLSYQEQERGKISASQYYQSLRESLLIDLSDKEFGEGWNRIFAGMVKGIAELLETLQSQIPIYCFTNTNNTHRDFWQKHYGQYLTPFRKVFISSEMGLRKPDKVAFDYVVEQIGVPQANILFLDDSLENIEGAQKVGLQTVHTKSFADTCKAVHLWLS